MAMESVGCMDYGDKGNSSSWASWDGDSSFAATPSGWNEFDQKKDPVVLSACRELVLVPGGISEKIRNLSEKRPEICWQYVGSSVLAHYHFNIAAVHDNTARALPQKKNATLPVFYAYVRHGFSPVEFAVQPKPLTHARLVLTDQLNAFYSDDTKPFKDDEIFEGVPCAAKDSRDSKWYRARLIRGRPGFQDVFVVFVDSGDERYVPIGDIKPLRKEFGRLPPLALVCRMKGVSINDLIVAKVDEFQKLIASVNGLVRVELTTTNEPFLVNIYHPTVADWNLGMPFYPRPMDKQQIAKEERLCKPKKTDDDPLTEEEDDDYSSDEEARIVRSQPHVFRFERLSKPFASPREKLYIAHIENARLIFVHTSDHVNWLQRKEKEMSDRWSTMVPFPDRALIADNACAFKTTDGSVVRAMIAKVTAQSIVLLAVDYGWKVAIKRAEFQNYLRALPRDCGCLPMVWLVRLPDSCDHGTLPHVGETAILRELLPCGEAVGYRLEKRTHGPPFKMSLFVGEDNEDVLELLASRKKELRVVHPCKELLVYNRKQVEFLRATENSDYIEEVACPVALAKGRGLFVNHSI